MSVCKAIVNIGPNKGNQCERPSTDNAYCGRHQRNYQHQILTEDNKIPCSQFFRGCNSIVLKSGKCDECKNKIAVKLKPSKCEHKGCKFRTKGEKYCNKHSRDVILDEAKEKGIKYCDVARGCYTIVNDGFSKCTDCRAKASLNESKQRKERNEIHEAIKLNPENKTQICVNCGKDYTQFETRYNKESKICEVCNETNARQDLKRQNRERNFKNEKFRYMETYYKSYVSGAQKRDYIMNLDFEYFKTLVVMPCYYCLHITENETNGIDRLNNDIGYEKENCVPCCETCNMMKHYFHPQFFIEICRIISKKVVPRKNFYKDWQEYYGRTNYKNYTNYKKETESKRNIKVNINQEDWDVLTRQPCYLCSYQDAKGIGLDRVDNTQRSYELDNVEPCCGTCNDIKNNFPLEIITEKAKIISDIWKDTVIFESIPRVKNPMREAKRKNTTMEKARNNWRSLGVYYDILSDSEAFAEFSKDNITEEEYKNLEQTVKYDSREEALVYIKDLLYTLNLRRNG